MNAPEIRSCNVLLIDDESVAEVFLHHRVLIVPVTEGGRVVGVVTRSAFFRALAERVLDRTSD